VAVTILVVEDERKTADTIQRYLEHAGYDVAVCSDGAEALNEAASGRCNLVVLDLALPTVDGIEICQALRASGRRALLSRHRSRGSVRWNWSRTRHRKKARCTPRWNCHGSHSTRGRDAVFAHLASRSPFITSACTHTQGRGKPAGEEVGTCVQGLLWDV
jgi:CheY-like chemotaxis protein